MNIKPKLKLFDLSMIVIGIVIGIGIFRAPSIVAQKTGTPLVFFLDWIFGGIVSLCGALTFAEIGSTFPSAGGFYKIFSHCYHPAFAFMLNWSLVIVNAASAAGITMVGAEYLCPLLLPASLQNNMSIKLIAIAVILILFLLNYLGIKIGARTQNVLSILKIATLVLLCSAIFKSDHSAAAPIAAMPYSSFSFLKAFGAGLISVFFTYNGYQYAINFGADIQHPRKNTPKAIFIGMGIVMILYLALNYTYYSVLGFNEMQHSNLLASELAKSIFGERGYTITSLLIFISVLGFINTSFMNNPRIYYAMADDKMLPRYFKQVNPKTMTQEFALSFFVMLILATLLLFGSFEKIVNYVMFIVSISLAAAAGTVFIFRKNIPPAKESISKTNPDIYRIKLYPFVPLFFIMILLILTVVISFADPESSLYGIIILLTGFPLYMLIKKAMGTKYNIIESKD